MSFHHIIPFSTLREVWNRLVRQHLALDEAGARVAIRQFLTLCDRDIENLDTLIDRIRAVALRQRAAHTPLAGLEVHEGNRLATAATWPSWNLVEGPTNRSDNPGDHYMDRFTAGITAQEATCMATIEVLYDRMQTFIASGEEPALPNLHAFAQACSTARLHLAGHGPILFRAEMWVEESPRMWRKRRDGERYTAPHGNGAIR